MLWGLFPRRVQRQAGRAGDPRTHSVAGTRRIESKLRLSQRSRWKSGNSSQERWTQMTGDQHPEGTAVDVTYLNLNTAILTPNNHIARLWQCSGFSIHHQFTGDLNWPRNLRSDYKKSQKWQRLHVVFSNFLLLIFLKKFLPSSDHFF